MTVDTTPVHIEIPGAKGSVLFMLLTNVLDDGSIAYAKGHVFDADLVTGEATIDLPANFGYRVFINTNTLVQQYFIDIPLSVSAIELFDLIPTQPNLTSPDRISVIGSKWIVADVDNYGDGVADATLHLQSLIDEAVTAGGGVVYLPKGTYLVSSTLMIHGDNVTLIGDGVDQTHIIGDSTTTGNTPIITVGNANTTDPGYALTVDATIGDASITISTTDAANFAVDGYALVKSQKQVDSESTTKFAGELHKITDVTFGVISLSDILYDSYLISESASAAPITMVKNVELKNFSTSSLAATSTLNSGHINAQFVENLTIENVEVGPAWGAGIHVKSCLNVNITDCNIHDIQGSSIFYGISIASASANVTVSSNRIARARHSVLLGGLSGTNAEGVPRNVTVFGNVSTEAATAHYDTHEPCDGVVFANNVALGRKDGVATNVAGFTIRGRNVAVIGNIIKHIPGRGIHIFGAQDGHVEIIGNYIANIHTDGVGIIVDSSGTDAHLISGNTIRDCDDSGIQCNGAVDDLVITGNSIVNCPLIGGNAAIFGNNSQRWVISGNKVVTNNEAVQSSGTSTDWVIIGNSLQGDPVSLVGTNIVFGNLGQTIPQVTGSKGGNTALASLLTTLDNLGLIDDQTT